MASCTTPITPDIESKGEQIVVDADLIPGQRVQVFLTTTAPLFAEDSDHYYPVGTDADVLIESEQGEKRLVYSGTPGIYENTSFAIEEGETYSLKASLNNFDAASVFAQTTVPVSTKMTDVTKSGEVVSENSDGSVVVSFDLIVGIDKGNASDCYLQLVPILIQDSAEPGGAKVSLERGSIELINENLQAQDFIHKDGIFIDYSNPIDNALKVRITFTIDSLDEMPDEVNLELRTTTQQYFDYHENLSRQLSSSSSPNSDPVVDYTNIENGWGIFSSFSFDEYKVEL